MTESDKVPFILWGQVMISLPISPTFQRHDLPIQKPLLDEACDWLFTEQSNGDFSGYVIASTGSRAGRFLEERLALRAETDGLLQSFQAPDFCTAAELADRALGLAPGVVADAPLRGLLWKDALQSVGDLGLAGLMSHPPKLCDFSGLADLAELVQNLHRDLAAQGLLFADVLSHDAFDDSKTERWRILVEIQSHYRHSLDELGRVDIHLARLGAAASEIGLADLKQRAVLLCVPELPLIQKCLFAKLAGQITLVQAKPQDLAESFDAWGCVQPEVVPHSTGLSLPTAICRFGENPREMVELGLRALRERDEPLPPEQVSFGLLEAECGPFLEQALAACGQDLHRPSGVKMTQTLPFTLLSDLLNWLSSPSFTHWVDLLTHPHFESWLVKHPALDLVKTQLGEAFDCYHAAHLPARRPQSWLDLKYDNWAPPLLREASDVAQQCLSCFTDGDAAMPILAGRLRAFMSKIYGDESIVPDATLRNHRKAGALQKLVSILESLENVPAAAVSQSALYMQMQPADFLRLVQQYAQRRDLPDPYKLGAIESLGWLELPLDPAASVIILGFNEERVTSAPKGHPFLPQELADAIGLPSDPERLARDAWVLAVLQATRSGAGDLVLIGGRTNNDGDPLRPSRLLFFDDATRSLDRMKQYVAESPKPELAQTSAVDVFVPPLAPTAPEVKRVSVTSFKAFLDSPYHFYINRLLGLGESERSAIEMDALLYGNFVHDITERFGRCDSKDSQDADEIFAALCQMATQSEAEFFGKEMSFAVKLQTELIQKRLRAFADAQAAWRGLGWRIDKVEEKIEIDFEGVELVGKIDRIDYHDKLGKYAVFDYKTGNKPNTVKKVFYKKRGTDEAKWFDLQLPLYVKLAEESLFKHGAVGVAGYINLSEQPTKDTFSVVDLRAPMATGSKHEWSDDELAAANEYTAELIQQMKNSNWHDEVGGGQWDSLTMDTLTGRGLLK